MFKLILSLLLFASSIAAMESSSEENKQDQKLVLNYDKTNYGSMPRNSSAEYSEDPQAEMRAIRRAYIKHNAPKLLAIVCGIVSFYVASGVALYYIVGKI